MGKIAKSRAVAIFRDLRAGAGSNTSGASATRPRKTIFSPISLDIYIYIIADCIQLTAMQVQVQVLILWHQLVQLLLLCLNLKFLLPIRVQPMKIKLVVDQVSHDDQQ